MLLPAGFAVGRSARKMLYYHDPMHPSYRSDRPGIAPDCNMELTPVYADETASGPALVRVDAWQAAAIGLRTEAARWEGLRRNAHRGPRRGTRVAQIPGDRRRRWLDPQGVWRRDRVVRGKRAGAGNVLQPGIASPQQAYLYALDSLERPVHAFSPEQTELAAKQVSRPVTIWNFSV